ncbi:MAG TPA: rRNA maturation RNase YbeY [Clostridiales bacterium]|nr:rRNA maturation RNase YbeY [Clostridiales bacterium]
MSTVVDIVNRQEEFAITAEAEDSLRSAALAALAAGDWRGPAELSLCLMDDAAMADLNRRYRGIDGPTDVLAFPQPGPAPPEEPPHLGDVAVGVQRAAAQGTSLEEEMMQLVIHGVLHLLGFDHEDEAGAGAMQERERLARSAAASSP